MRYCLLLLALAMPAASQTLIDTDFARTDHPAGAAEKNPRVTGELPRGWSDNSGWAKTWVDYAKGEEEGRAYLNVNVTKVEDGKVQMMHILPNLEAEAYYRVSLLARSPSRAAVQIGIRAAGPPYQFVWQETPGLAESWKEVTHDFRLGKHASPVRFFINVEGTGQVHLAKLKVERRTKEDLVAEMKSRYGGSEPKNLMRNSRGFFLKQCGWSSSREFEDSIAYDRKTRGPSGEIQTSRIIAPNGFDFYSPAFEPGVPEEPYTASLYVRGNGTLKLSVLADGRTRGEKSIEVREEWTRIQTTFKSALLARAHVLRLQGKGEMNVDALQVNAGAAATPYVMQTLREVELDFPTDSYDAMFTRVLFDDWRPAFDDLRHKAPYLEVIVRGGEEDVRARITNAYGESIDRLATTTRDRTAEIDLSPFGDRPFGAFRVEAWVELNGKPVSPIAETVYFRVRKPRYWKKDAPESPFGVHTQSTTRHNFMAKSIGINWVRLHDAGTKYIGWRYLEPEKGKWVFDDAPIQRYREAHLKVMGCFSTAPDWATNIDKHRNTYFDQFWRPKSMDDFANYVRVASQHYKGVIDTWDVWNEPWNHEWWAVRYDEEKGKKDVRSGYITSDQPEADFARMVDVCASTAREVDPAIKVLGINSYAGGSGGKWTSGIVAADGLKLPDVYCYHQYTGQSNLFPADSVERGFNAALGPVRDKLSKIDKPVWMTEGSSVRDKIGSGLYLHTFPNGAGKEDILATSDNLCRFVTSLLANGVSKVFLYSMHSHRTFGDGSEWRVLVTEEGYLHPSAAAFSNLAWHLEDTTFVKRIELSPKLNAYLFESRDRTRSVAVLSPLPGSGAQALPAIDAPFEDLFGNPIKDRKKPTATLVYLPLPGSSQELERVLMAR